jgi:RNA polymerase sigma factor (TIGR02999 family)
MHVPQRKELTSKPDASDTGQPVLEQVYQRLRRIAARIMQSQRAGHTLWPTEVVHEAMAKALAAGHDPKLIASQRVNDLIGQLSNAMRQVLVDYHRHRNAVKRGRGRSKVSLDQIEDLEAALESETFDWPALNAALDELARHDPRRHAVVTLRFFGGLDNRQIASQLDLDERTVGRDWAAAKLWLRKRLASTVWSSWRTRSAAGTAEGGLQPGALWMMAMTRARCHLRGNWPGCRRRSGTIASANFMMIRRCVSGL